MGPSYGTRSGRSEQRTGNTKRGNIEITIWIGAIAVLVNAIIIMVIARGLARLEKDTINKRRRREDAERRARILLIHDERWNHDE